MSDASSHVLTGRCLCGACTFDLVGAPNWTGHCHCDSCRRATASPMTTFIGQQNGTWRWTGAAPQTYESSSGTTRGFCGTCGSPMFFQSERYPEEAHFYAALLDDPEAVTPVANFHLDEKLSWIHEAAELPEATDIPAVQL